MAPRLAAMRGPGQPTFLIVGFILALAALPSASAQTCAVTADCAVNTYCNTQGTTATADDVCAGCPDGQERSTGVAACTCINENCAVTGCRQNAIWERCEKLGTDGVIRADSACSAPKTAATAATATAVAVAAVPRGSCVAINGVSTFELGDAEQNADGTATGNFATCCVCPAGEYASAGNSVGTIKNPTCKICPNSNAWAPQGSSRISDCKCTAGYSGMDGETCTACPIGTYKMSWGSGVCTSCPPGMSSSTTGATRCSACPAGSFSGSVGSQVCTQCPVDTWSMINATQCSTCPSGTTTDGKTSSVSSASCMASRGAWFDRPKADAILALLVLCFLMLILILLVVCRMCWRPEYVPVQTVKEPVYFADPPVYERAPPQAPFISGPAPFTSAPAPEMVIMEPHGMYSGGGQMREMGPPIYHNGPYAQGDTYNP